MSSTLDKPWIYGYRWNQHQFRGGARLTLPHLNQLLAKHWIHRWTDEEVQDVLATTPLPLAAGSADAISEHALLLLPQLHMLYRQG